MSRIPVSMAKSMMLAAALSICSTVSAVPISMEAVDNATVQPAGPRSGSSGKNFFNVEGSANGNFASYGVADFNFGTLPIVLDVASATLNLTQSNASFSTTGDVIVSLDTSATLADIQPGGTSPLAFDGAEPGTATDVTDGDLSLTGLGTFTYTVGTNGDVDSYALNLDAAVKAELISRLTTGGDIRLVIGTGASDVAATWAGFSNATFDGPTLVLDIVVPEPATGMMTVLCCLPVAMMRRTLN